MKQHWFEVDPVKSSVKKKKIICTCGYKLTYKKHYDSDTKITIGNVPDNNPNDRYEKI